MKPAKNRQPAQTVITGAFILFNFGLFRQSFFFFFDQDHRRGAPNLANFANLGRIVGDDRACLAKEESARIPECGDDDLPGKPGL